MLPAGSKTEFSAEMNSAHLKDEPILSIARESTVVGMAAQLLGVDDINIFTTRILCKMPKIGEPIPWHQDSKYWPLEPLKVVSFWLALGTIHKPSGQILWIFDKNPEFI